MYRWCRAVDGVIRAVDGVIGGVKGVIGAIRGGVISMVVVCCDGWVVYMVGVVRMYVGVGGMVGVV